MHSELVKEFQQKGIPIDSPNFYDHQNFINEEKADPTYLIKFAKFVATRPYSDDYLLRAEKAIKDVAEILRQQLLDNGRQGACVDISGILARILELKGVWCACIKGSCTIEFPKNSREEKTYYWSVDSGQFTAGHSWVFAPPFSIVDITIREQPYSGAKKDYIPESLLIKQGTKISPTVEDIISPEVRAILQTQGMPKNRMLENTAPEMKLVQEFFPAQLIEINSTKFRFLPIAVHASIESLQDMNNMKFSNLYPYEMYSKFIEANVERVA